MDREKVWVQESKHITFQTGAVILLVLYLDLSEK